MQTALVAQHLLKRLPGARPHSHLPRPARAAAWRRDAGRGAGRGARARAAAGAEDEELELLERILQLAKDRKDSSEAGSGDAGEDAYHGDPFNVLTFNAISQKGLDRFPPGRYAVSG